MQEGFMDYNHLLNNKNAFITIAGQGIGKAIALLFAKQGAKVAIGARRKEKLEKALAELRIICPDAQGYQADYSDPAQTEEVCKNVLRDFGKIDVLVNVVGVNISGAVHEMKDADLEHVLETNFKSYLRCIRAFLPGMLERRSGNIVNISSIHSIETMPGFAVYAGTKGAINAAARAIALDYAQSGIRINTVCPGLIMSDAILEEIASYPEGKQRENFVDMLSKMQPLSAGRVGDIANAALFLASEMSSYITGQIIIADGGASIKAHPGS